MTNFDDFETQVTCEEYYGNPVSDQDELDYRICSYGEPPEDPYSTASWLNENEDPLSSEDWQNEALFEEDGSLTEHAMDLLATLESQGAFI